MSRLSTTTRALRTAIGRTSSLPATSRAALTARTLTQLTRVQLQTPRPADLSTPRRFASHTSTPPSQTPEPVAGAELRTAIEKELEILRARLTNNDTFLYPLSSDETEFVNMGQVPAPPAGGEVMALLDLAPPGISRDRPKAGPQGKGTHVPLLAHAGQTEPAVPCYPLVELFTDLAPRVLGRVREAVAAQGKELGSANLVAVVVPPKGEKRDLAVPLALALFRLAIFEGNGHDESAV